MPLVKPDEPVLEIDGDYTVTDRFRSSVELHQQ